jgi:uncharacterized protein (DUF58 family)
MPTTIAQSLAEGQQAGAQYSLSAPRRSPQGTSGSQLGRLAGESMEFMDHREYQPGDDLRRLDWAAYARSDKMIVKLFRQEVCPHLDVVIDGSRSMDLPGSQKGQVTAVLAAALTTAADNTGHTHRAFVTGQGCQPVANGTALPALWQGLAFDSKQSPPDSFRMLPPPWQPHGIRAFISDLLWLGDPLELMTAMSGGAAAVYVLQVLATADAAPEHQGNVRLVDCESDLVEDVFLDATALARYRNNIEGHRDAWRRAARQVGAVLVPLVAEEVCSGWDFSPLVEAGILTV